MPCGERLDGHAELAEDERREIVRQLSDLSRQQAGEHAPSRIV